MSNEFDLADGFAGDCETFDCDALATHLTWIDTSPLASALDDLFPSHTIKRWIYSPLTLLKLLILQDKKKVSYRTLVSTLTLDECIALGLEEISPDVFRIPCASTVHHFAYERLGLAGFNSLMLAVGNLACKYIRGGSGMVDSTPIPAAIHDEYAEFNPHYSQKMFKLHIFHYAQFPLAAEFSGGCAYDGNFFSSLSDMVQPMKPILTKMMLDGGYDSYEIHAEVWYKFRVHPFIGIRENAVYNPEGSEMRILHWVNKLWNKGGDVHKPLLDNLEFLYEQGRVEQVGAYFRNINLTNPHFQEECKGRSVCERTHSHMKATCNFTVHGMQHQSKELYIIRRFVTYQLIIMTNIMHNMTNIQNSACYV